MKDKEILELAAKAAGYPVEWVERRVARIGAFKQIQHARRDGFTMSGKEWNPLTDDGDALRLAVTLGLHVYGCKIGCNVDDYIFIDKEDCGGDPYAATRRAITRAAAEIGKMMEQKT